MIIECRDRELKYPLAIKNDKKRLILDWLLEFRFSSFEILAERIGQSRINASRFFSSLISTGVISAFTNIHTGKTRYAHLTSEGLYYLKSIDRNVDHAVIREKSLGNYSQIMHDLMVQKIILKRLANYDEVISDRNISFGDYSNRPDALFKSESKGNTIWSAIEFERWRKEKKRIYIAFMNHVAHIKQRRYAGVIYFFQNDLDCSYYQGLFDESSWPLYKRKSGSGKITTLNGSFFPDELVHLRKRFVFIVETIDF